MLGGPPMDADPQPDDEADALAKCYELLRQRAREAASLLAR